jgi:hypothetical protein
MKVTTQVQEFSGSTFRVKDKDKDGIEDPILSNEFKDVYGQAR